jgi:hypothetical protein
MTGGRLQLPFWYVNKTRSLTDDGYTNSAGHGASGMSLLGGLIRIGALTGRQPVARTTLLAVE